MLFLVQSYTNESNLLNYVCLDSVTGKTVTVSASQWANSPVRDQICGVDDMSGQPKFVNFMTVDCVADNPRVYSIAKEEGSCFAIQEILFDSRSGRGSTQFKGIKFEPSGSFKSEIVKRLPAQTVVYDGFNNPRLEVKVKRIGENGVLKETSLFFERSQCTRDWGFFFPSTISSVTQLTCDTKIYGAQSSSVFSAINQMFNGRIF